ncbi:MAG TPA: helix-turn-helix domain-containing protein [Candidatus Binatia bacterium]|nr:helix-turn-helix domain-containing protein [Candidatus Binatia bacterium]
MTRPPSWDSAVIKALRERLGLSQEDFAHAVGVTTSTVNRWEKGWSRPTKLAARRLNTLGRRT